MKRKATLNPELTAGTDKPDLQEKYITPLLFFGIDVKGLQYENGEMQRRINELQDELIKALKIIIDRKDKTISALYLKVVKDQG
jgi:hypothetical protein